MKFERQIKYFYLRFLRLKGDPYALALGLACGVFTGMLPIMPFQTALAIILAALLRASKITGALGTWVSNPLNWYFLYYYSYKIGAFLLGLQGKHRVFLSIMAAVQRGEESMAVIGKTLGAGGAIIAAFLVGGLVLGVAASLPAYFISLHIFKSIKAWRQSKKEPIPWHNPDR
ncbi:MAG: DUF2062 domain-containing protein [Desulfatiglandaceae bacterium]